MIDYWTEPSVGLTLGALGAYAGRLELKEDQLGPNKKLEP